MAALLLLPGCRSFAPAPQPLPVLGEERRIEAWLERSRAQGRGRRGVRAVGRLNLDSPGGSGKVKQVILAERPARLRLESLNLLGHTQTLLVTDGQSFAFFDGRELSSGAVTRDVLREYMGLDLEPREAVRLILGAPLDDEAPGPRALGILGLADERIVYLPEQRLRFGRDGDLLGLEVLDAQGATRWSAEYARWRELPGGRYPFEMVLYFPLTELRAELDFKEVELNPALDPALFRVPRRGQE